MVGPEGSTTSATIPAQCKYRQVVGYKANFIGRVCISTAAPERSLFPLQARRQKFAFFEKDCSLVSTLRRCLAH